MSIYVGRELRKKREEKNISLTQVSEELFIRNTYLQAIENGRPEILPSPVQGRGFVRMYSDYLGLDVDAVLNAWDNPDTPFPFEIDALPPEIEHTQPRKSENQTGHQKITNNGNKVEPEPSDLENTIFQEIGAKLCSRRESLKLTFDDAELHTLVRTYYLKKMEEGRFDELPSTVQARGMLNNYASFLNLDVEEVMLQFAEAIQHLSEKKKESLPGFRERKANPHQKPVKKAGKLKQFLTPDLFVGLTVLAGMAAIIIYSAVTISEFRTKSIKNTPDFRSEFIAQLRQEENILPTPSAGIIETPMINTVLTEPVTDVITPEGEEALLTGAIQVRVEANQRSFLRVKTDGKEVYKGRTLPGNSYPFDASEVIEITTGNAAAISITYNQQRLGIMGDIGENLTLQFFSDMPPVTPTPLNSATPTATFEPTYTSRPASQTPTVTITPYIP